MNIFQTINGSKITVGTDMGGNVIIVIDGVTHTLTTDAADNLAWGIIGSVKDADHDNDKRETHENDQACLYCYGGTSYASEPDGFCEFATYWQQEEAWEAQRRQDA